MIFFEHLPFAVFFFYYKFLRVEVGCIRKLGLLSLTCKVNCNRHLRLPTIEEQSGLLVSG